MRFPGLRRDIVRWVLDVEAVARCCGADEAQPLHADGYVCGAWYDADKYAEECGGVPDLSPISHPNDVRACCRAGWSQVEYKHRRTGGFPPHTAEHRAEQLMRLDGLGKKPSEKELGAMAWPHRAWWADRDRIGMPQSL